MAWGKLQSDTATGSVGTVGGVIEAKTFLMSMGHIFKNAVNVLGICNGDTASNYSESRSLNGATDTTKDRKSVV